MIEREKDQYCVVEAREVNRAYQTMPDYWVIRGKYRYSVLRQAKKLTAKKRDVKLKNVHARIIDVYETETLANVMKMWEEA